MRAARETFIVNDRTSLVVNATRIPISGQALSSLYEVYNNRIYIACPSQVIDRISLRTFVLRDEQRRTCSFKQSQPVSLPNCM